MKQIRRWMGALAVVALLAGGTLAAEVAVDVNAATQEQLVELPGIGPSKAKAIIAYRTEHPFERPEDLLNVQGIGEHTFESLKGRIRVGSAAVAR